MTHKMVPNMYHVTAVLILTYVPLVVRTSSAPPVLCIMTHCLAQFTQCSLDKECMAVLNCFSDCDPTDTGCAFSCGGSPLFTSLLVCMVEHHCVEEYPESGKCLATDDQAMDITNYDLVAGDWWTVWGQSCGQEDEYGVWSGSYDWVPCAHHRIVQLDDDQWVNNTTFCPGLDSQCTGNMITTVPRVHWSSPGVLRHEYPQSEAPIVPQIEDRKWMWIKDDWALVVWCGYNPVQVFNGAFVLSRRRSNGSIPVELELEIREQLEMYGMDLDTMCLTDSTKCSV